MILFIIITWRYHNHPGKTPQGGLSCVMAILCCLSFPELGLGTILFCGSGLVFSWLVTFFLKCSNIIRVFHKIMIVIRIELEIEKYLDNFPSFAFFFCPHYFSLSSYGSWFQLLYDLSWQEKDEARIWNFPGLHNNPYLRAAALAKWETKSATRKYKR